MRTIKRPRPNSDITVSAFTSDDPERGVRVAGFDPTDYLTTAEAHQLARALDAEADELDAAADELDARTD